LVPMDDEEKIYWLKITLGISCGLLSILVVPQGLVSEGVRVGLWRLLWLMGTWLGLPIPLVILLVLIGFVGSPEKKQEQGPQEKKPFTLKTFVELKASLKKLGGVKFILKTGVGAFFFLFLLSSTVIFTLLFP
jgi:hypothetical protein